MRFEYRLLHSPPKYPGKEVVFLPGSPPITVCIPHKVGSHAWGVFSRTVNKIFPGVETSWRSKVWTERSNLRAVVVRHPLDRLVSAYRMIFEDYCDPKSKFVKKDSVCKREGIRKDKRNPLEQSREQEGKGGKPSLNQLLGLMKDEYINGGDRYISRIWYKFHPEPVPEQNRFKFSFNEFVRLLVNGSMEFKDDPYVLNHKQLSNHWAPYWYECPVCHQNVRPDFILHLETLEEDIQEMLKVINLSSFSSSFPHTHKQKGVSSSSRTKQLLGELSSWDLKELMNLYRLDFELFNYSSQIS